MGKHVYLKSALTGGAADALDSIDGNLLNNLDLAFVTVGGVVYTYVLNHDLTTAESSPGIISPDKNYGTKRWVLQIDGIMATSKLYWDDVNGRWGIGTPTPASTFDVVGGDIQCAGEGRFKGWYNAGTGLGAEIGISGSEGYLLAYNRTTSGYVDFNVSGGGSASVLHLATDGTISRGGNTHLDAAESDERIKKNIVPYRYGLTDLLKFEPKEFIFKDRIDKITKTPMPERSSIGFIAQEVQEYFPEMVYTKKGKIDEVNDTEEVDLLALRDVGDHVHYMLINAIKELNTRLEKLDKKSFADPNTWK